MKSERSSSLEEEKSRREQTLESLEHTLNRIYLQDHAKHKIVKYELPQQAPQMAAEEIKF